MKLVSYRVNGIDSFGIETEQGIIDLKNRLSHEINDLKALLTIGWEEATAFIGDRADYSRSDVELLPVIPNPGTIWCTGLNTHSHFEEVKDRMDMKETPKAPMFFLRSNSTLVGSGSTLEKPIKEPAFDYEGEIAVVIGKACRNVSEAEALDHVAGYSCFNDASARLFQISSNQMTTGKNAYRSGGFGPCLTTRDEIDLNSLELFTRVNGEQRQHLTMDDLIFSIPFLISHISEVNWLQPGDVIVAGTPKGAGGLANPPSFLTDGDTIEIEAPAIGTLINTVREQKL